MKRKRQQEHDEEVAREQAEARREALLAELRTRQAGGHQPEPEPPPAEPVPEPEPDSEDEDEDEDRAADESEGYGATSAS